MLDEKQVAERLEPALPYYKQQPNCVAELDRRLREYASQRAALDAAEAFDLFRAEQLRIHAFLGCATFFEYMERRLGYAPHTARERMRVARGLVALPRTSTALARGLLTFSTARELTRVATPDTEEEWLAATAGKSVREVEELVAGHRPGDRPSDRTHPELETRPMTLAVPPQVRALWREARKKLASELGSEIADADLLEVLCRAYLNPGSGAEGPAHQIAYKQCKDCKRATQNGAGREIDVAAHVVERAACDARLLGSLDASAPERATASVTPRVREQVFARDEHHCRVPGCRSARNLEVHHIEPQLRGGSHHLWNLLLLCGGHHDAHHAGLLSITGCAPYEVRFAWTYGRPMPPGLSATEREAFIVQRVDELMRNTNSAVPPGTRSLGHAGGEHAHDVDDMPGDHVPVGPRSSGTLAANDTAADHVVPRGTAELGHPRGERHGG